MQLSKNPHEALARIRSGDIVVYRYLAAGVGQYVPTHSEKWLMKLAHTAHEENRAMLFQRHFAGQTWYIAVGVPAALKKKLETVGYRAHARL